MSLAYASDINTLISSINNTLTRYGYSTSSNASSTSTGIVINASFLNGLIDKLLMIDADSWHISRYDQKDILNNNKVSSGQLISLSTINNLQNCTSHLYSDCCSCNCNFCSCNCNFCSCDSNSCSCDSDTFTHYCNSYSMHTCFLPGTIIFTSNGPKKIEEVVSGDYVLTVDGSFDQVITTWSLEVGDIPVKTYQGDSFSITLTEDHLIPIDENGNVFYPKLIFSDENNIELRNLQYYPESLLKDLIYLTPNLKRITNNSCVFKNKKFLIDICKNIVETDFDYMIKNNELIVFGKIGEFSLSQYLKVCFNNQKKIIFPQWIYKLSKNIIQYYKEVIDNGLEFDNIDQCLQIKLLLNSAGWDYKRDYNKLIFVKDLLNENKNNLTSIIDSKYTGEVFNLQCNSKRFIASEIIVGDGYV